MGRVTLTVADLVQPSQDRKRGSVVGSDGTRLGVFAEKVSQLQIGRTYDIEFTDGQYPNVKSVKPATSAPAATPFVSGAYRQNDTVSAPPAGHPCKDEQIFVVALLKSLIEAGHVKNDKTELWNTTQMLRGLYKHTFGFEAIKQQIAAE